MIKYDKYKPSGIDWLGDIPNDWEVKRVKDILIKIGSGVTPKGGSEVYVKSGIPLIRSQNVYDDGLRIDNVSYISEAINDKMKNSQIQPNDILINITGASIGRSCVVPNSLAKANINQHIIYLRIDSKLVSFITYFIKSNSFKEYINLIQAGTSKEALNMGQTMNIPILLPDADLQTQIANYLNTKTQAIDKKINLLTQKVNYFKEYRKSLINETVCKGLDKNVKLKDSSIEWIGQIPKHWEVRRFKDVCYKNTTGGTPSTSSPEHFYGNNTWVTIADLGNDKFVKNSKLGLTDEAIKLANIPITPEGSLIYSFKLTVGKIAFAKKDLYTNEALISIMPNKLIDLEYCYFMLPVFLLMNATENIYGAKMLNQRLISNTVLVYPPLSEQTQIANYLDQKTQTIDKLVSNINTQITTLKELRKTLINDAVTGKIKVVA